MNLLQVVTGVVDGEVTGVTVGVEPPPVYTRWTATQKEPEKTQKDPAGPRRNQKDPVIKGQAAFAAFSFSSWLRLIILDFCRIPHTAHVFGQRLTIESDHSGEIRSVLQP